VTDVGCCWHGHAPWAWTDPREIEYELRERRRERRDRETDLGDLEERQRALEHELAELREQIRAKTP
jgi:hypothetical protein